LDQMVFKPSELQPHLEQRVRDNLKANLSLHRSHHIKLIFKKGGPLGPNALALPGGTIIFTDELVELAEHDEELTAVLAHEIGHVVYRHGMRRMVQDSLLSFVILALTGDVSGVSEIFLGLPAVLTELAYSREFERDADQYALAFLQAHNIPTSRFADFLIRLDDSSKKSKGEDNGKWTGYLSTHPPTPERVKTFQPHSNSE
jgi:Zn-dependent protease with chaperone function